MSKDFNWKQYKTDIIKKYVEKYGSREKAIVGDKAVDAAVTNRKNTILEVKSAMEI